MISGAALVVEHLATAMAKRGHQVLVIAASDRDEPYITIDQNLTIVRLQSIHNPMRAKQRFLLFPHYAILQALNKFRPDLLHVHEPLQTSWAAISYAQQNHIPMTLTIHQLPAFASDYLPNLPGLRTSTEALLWQYARWLMKKFQIVIAPSRTTSKFLTSNTGIETMAISNGVDLAKFYPETSAEQKASIRQHWNIPADIPVLLHVGRLDVEKHVDRILKACATVMGTTEAHLFIAGDGCEKDSLIRLCRELGIEERVHFAGFVCPQNGLPEIYRMADAFVTASEIETQGIVLLEAAASGLPIVAVDATCISEIVRDHANGILVKADDPHALSNAILTLVEHPETARTMGHAGRILAREHASHITDQKHEGIYTSLMPRANHQRTMISGRPLHPHRVAKTRSSPMDI